MTSHSSVWDALHSKKNGTEAENSLFDHPLNVWSLWRRFTLLAQSRALEHSKNLEQKTRTGPAPLEPISGNQIPSYLFGLAGREM